MKFSIGMNRRSFLMKGASGAAGLVLHRGLSFSGATQTTINDHNIITRKLGRTGINLPIINMGVMNADNPAVLSSAYDAGIRLFDTAWRYQNGRNERMVGNVIKEMGIRDKIVLATKVPLAFGNHSSYTISEIEEFRKTKGKGLEKELKEDFLKTFEESLQRLQQNYVDILYVHSVKDPKTIELPFLLEAITQLKKEGKLRFLGVSSHQNAIPVFKKVLEMDIFDVVLACLNFKMPDRDVMRSILNQLNKKGLGIIAMKTQAIYDYSSITHHTAALKYVLQNDFITTAIPGFTTFEQLEEDFSVARDLKYTPEEEKFLNDFWKKTAVDPRVGDIPCQGCETCMAGCPNNVSIPDLMRTYTYASGYGNFEHARITYETVPPNNNLSQCQDCSACTASCINGINIPSNIRKLKVLFI